MESLFWVRGHCRASAPLKWRREERGTEMTTGDDDVPCLFTCGE